MPHIHFIAGESSGDQHGAALIRALRELDPSVTCEGLGGVEMAAAGMALRHDLAGEAIMGFAEVVWTGIHLGHYGRDLSPSTSLGRVLEAAVKSEDIPRIRLSSLEPEDLTPGILRLAPESEKICPHFHIPLQSGDTEILKKMGRPYTGEFFADLVLSIKKAMPHAAVGADVLAGFPGETEKAFRNTLALIEKLPLTYLHVFPYSPRPGTPAARFPGRVDPGKAKERCRVLRGLGEKKRQDFYARMKDREAQVCILGPKEGKPGLYRGITDNYIPCVIASDKSLRTSSLVRRRPGEVDSPPGE